MVVTVPSLEQLEALSQATQTVFVTDLTDGGWFQWTGATLTPDGVNIITATGKTQGYWVRMKTSNLKNNEPEISRSDIQDASEENKRNDQASMIRLDDGRLLIAYSHFGPGSEDLDESSVHIQYSNDNGETWTESEELVAPIELGSYIPSLYKKSNGNILMVFFVREQATPVFLSSLRSIEYSPDMTTIVTAMETILDADGYYPVGSDRLFYDENSERLLMPYPVLMSGLGASTNSVYQSTFLVSDDEGDTWSDSGLTFDGFLDLNGFGGSMEPGFFVNKDKITIYSRNIIGNINACDLTWTGSAYTKGSEYKLKIGAMNAQSTIKYVPLLRGWIASYTRLYDTPTSTRNQIDVSFSKDATYWFKIMTVDDLLQVGGFMVNEPNIFIDDRIYISYSIDKTNGTYDLKLLTIPFESLIGIDNKAIENYTANPTISDVNEAGRSRFLLRNGFDASVYNHRFSSFIDIKSNVESATPSSRSLPSFIAGQYITNTDSVVRNLDMGVISAFAPQQIIDKTRVKSVLSKFYVSGWSNNSLKNSSVIDVYAVINVEEILPASVTGGTITDKYFIRQLGASDKSYFNGSIGIGVSAPTEKLHLVGNQRIESGSIKVIGTNFDLALNSDSLVIKNKIVTASNWSRVMSQITSNADVPYFSFGAYGTNQTFNYGYIGLGVSPHSGALMKFTSTGVGIGLATTDTPTEKLDVVGNGKFTGTVNVATAPTTANDVVRLTELNAIADGNLSKTANYTVLTTDFGRNGHATVFVDATAGAVQIELPTAASMAGKTVNVIKTDASANDVTVKGNGSTNINAANTLVLSNQFDKSGGIKSNGTQYYIF